MGDKACDEAGASLLSHESEPEWARMAGMAIDLVLLPIIDDSENGGMREWEAWVLEMSACGCSHALPLPQLPTQRLQHLLLHCLQHCLHVLSSCSALPPSNEARAARAAAASLLIARSKGGIPAAGEDVRAAIVTCGGLCPGLNTPQDVRAAIVTCGGLCPGLNTVIRELVWALWFRYGVRNISGIDVRSRKGDGMGEGQILFLIEFPSPTLCLSLSHVSLVPFLTTPSTPSPAFLPSSPFSPSPLPHHFPLYPLPPLPSLPALPSHPLSPIRPSTRHVYLIPAPSFMCACFGTSLSVGTCTLCFHLLALVSPILPPPADTSVVLSAVHSTLLPLLLGGLSLPLAHSGSRLCAR
ncbi:unnamed protein product [Closterium sp. Naga37s-1]|nr:unnamed protein product [Closterium sp. Naga37s-1]